MEERLSPENGAKLRLEREASEYVANDVTRRLILNEFIAQQQKGFEEEILSVDELINKLKSDGKIGQSVTWTARIKSPLSCEANEKKVNKNMNKGLDDIFAIRILASTDEELNIVLSELKKQMSVRKEKHVQKPNGYDAYHLMLYPSNPDNRENNTDNIQDYRPVFEVQARTHEVDWKCIWGTASHFLYKGEETVENVRDMCRRGMLKVGENIPYTYAPAENGGFVVLSEPYAIKKIYPFLSDSDIECGEQAKHNFRESQLNIFF